MDEYDHLYKILLLGDSGVGKTNIISRFRDGTFNLSQKATIGIDFATKQITVGGKCIKLQLWDTAGQERFRSITTSYYRNAQGILLVYDISNTETFLGVQKWYSDIQKQLDLTNTPIMLVGNKSDLDHKRQVLAAQGEEYAQIHGLAFIETSALNADNITEAFDAIIKRLTPSNNTIMATKMAAPHHGRPYNPQNLVAVAMAAPQHGRPYVKKSNCCT